MDTEGKKVVLYNTSVDAMLKGKEKYIKKLRSVLDVFRNRKDIVLLWRPHPLNEAAHSSMQPHLLDEYKKIIADYKLERWGIYDDTSDLHRAIAISDAYYGDPSSVVPLYGVTGKPIMIQNIKDFGEESLRDYALSFENLYDDGEYLWFSAMDFNALFRMNKQTWSPEYMGNFPNDSIAAKRMCGKSFYNNGKLYFAPLNSSHFYAYDLSKNVFDILPISQEFEKCLEKEYLFLSIIAYRQYIFYIGFSFDGIIRYDTKTGEIHRFSDWVGEVNNLIGKVRKYYFAYVCVVANKLYCPLVLTKAVLILNMDTGEYQLIELNDISNGYQGIAYDGESFWLASRSDDRYLINWDGKCKEVTKYENIKSGNGDSWLVMYAGGNSWYIPYHSNNDVFFKVRKNKIEPIHQDKDISVKFTMHNVIKDTIYINKCRDVGSSLMAFDAITHESHEQEIRLNDEQYNRIKSFLSRLLVYTLRDCQIWKDCIVEERSTLGLNLSSYLDYIINNAESMETQTLQNKRIELFKGITENVDSTAGQSIYEFIKASIID